LSERLSRILLLVVCTAIGAAYLLLFFGSDIFDASEQQLLGEIEAPLPGIRIYLEPLGLDLMRDSMQLRISVQPASLAAGSLPTFDHDLVLRLMHDGESHQVDLRTGQSVVTTTVELDLSDGDVSHYPFDSYHAQVSITCVDQQAESRSVAITAWKRLLGFRLQSRVDPASSSDKTTVSIVARRTLAFRYFAVTAYGAMVVLASGALTIGTLVFLRLRRPEPTLLGALAAIVFALPALRNALPGGPPLGVLADVFVFLWAELVAVAALAMVIVTWALKAPRP
jgi:hypothetical protein